MTTGAVVLTFVKMKPSNLDTKFIDQSLLISPSDLEDGKRLAGPNNV
jgi:hypothetical protein